MFSGNLLFFMLLAFKALEFTLQVAASTNKEIDSHIPNYRSLPPQLTCQLHNVTMHVSFLTIWLCLPIVCMMQLMLRYKVKCVVP
uniref:Non-specific lipid-transfer protein Auxin response factor n=1 Tax=Rhizophora mucronata TaxID=61149 RepID=A0A2P2KEP5_RHIMU